MIRIGYSLDSHKFDFGEGFILGGVFIPCEYKVIAHSDGDCLYHALAESMLGALNLGSLGENYPDNDPKWKGKDSSYFVRDAYLRIKNLGYHINNIDMMVLLDRPKLKDYLLDMEKNIAKLVECDIGVVSIKPTTLEGLADLSSKGVTCISSILVSNEN